MLVALAACTVGRADAAPTFPSPPTTWLHSSFAQCVRLRESGDGRGSSNLYGMQAGWGAAGGTGSAANASRAEQDYRAYRLFERYGDSPWRPYDGCHWP